MSNEDPTEEWRRDRFATNNVAVEVFTREQLAARVGETWDTTELQRDYEVHSFLAPFVRVKRKSDSAMGWLEFGHHPRLYWGWTPDNT